ncbi:hypothetical protein QTP88_010394 [Uroleucon formosanum]
MAMTSNNVQNFSSCSVLFAELDTPVKCDGCISVFHTKCTGLSPSKLKCLSLKTRNLKYFCESCNNGLRDIPELKMLINRLLSEVNELKNQKNNGNNVSHYSEEFIFNEIGDCNMRASNLILYNVPESNSDNTADRIAHDSNVVSNLIDSIIIGDKNIKPVKLLRLGCVYIPPGASSDIYSNHCDIVESIFFRFPEHYFVIVGDFNLSSFDWSVDPNSQNHRSGGIIFNSYINFLNLEQCNIIKNCDGRTLDCLMLSKNAELISNCYSVDSLVHTIDKYHSPLDVVIKFKISSMSDHYESPYILNFKKCNFNEISHFLSSIDFNLNLNKNQSLDALVDSFYEIIYHTFSLFVPNTKIYNSYSPAWANAELRNLIVKKKCAHKKYKLSTSFANYIEFSELRKKCKKLNQMSHNQYISDLENSLQINIKPFWNYVNSLKKTKNDVPDCMNNYNNVTSANISETVKLFADYFSSVYVSSSLNSNEVVTLSTLSSNDNHINLSSWSIVRMMSSYG